MIIGAMTILAQVFIIGLISLRRSPVVSGFIRKYALSAAWAVSLFAVTMSLWYSEVAHFPPCVLCWWQRVFMFPLAFILGIAVFRKDKNIVPYGLALAIPGALIGLYNSYLQYGGSPLIPCGVPGLATISCAQRFVFEFGYVTLPLMSLTGFALLIALLWSYRKTVVQNY